MISGPKAAILSTPPTRAGRSGEAQQREAGSVGENLDHATRLSIVLATALGAMFWVAFVAWLSR
jgi:hypothetical protein